MDPVPCDLPSALVGSMGREKKPFTYLPGGLDFSEIRSPKMAKRLARHQANIIRQQQQPGDNDNAGPPKRNAAAVSAVAAAPQPPPHHQGNVSSPQQQQQSESRPQYQKQRSISELLSFSEADGDSIGNSSSSSGWKNPLDDRPMYNPYANAATATNQSSDGLFAVSNGVDISPRTAATFVPKVPVPVAVQRVQEQQQHPAGSSIPPPPPPPPPSAPEEPMPFTLGTKANSDLVSTAHASLHKEKEEKMKKQEEEQEERKRREEEEVRRRQEEEMRQIRMQYEEENKRNREKKEEKRVQLMRQVSTEDRERMLQEQQEFIKRQREEAEQIARVTQQQQHQQQDTIVDHYQDQEQLEEKSRLQVEQELEPEPPPQLPPQQQQQQPQQLTQHQQQQQQQQQQQEPQEMPDKVIEENDAQTVEILPETLEEFNKTAEELESRSPLPPLPPLNLELTQSPAGAAPAATQSSKSPGMVDFDEPLVLENMDDNEIRYHPATATTAVAAASTASTDKHAVLESGVDSMQIADVCRRNREAIDEAMVRQRASMSPRPRPQQPQPQPQLLLTSPRQQADSSLDQNLNPQPDHQGAVRADHDQVVPSELPRPKSARKKVPVVRAQQGQPRSYYDPKTEEHSGSSSSQLQTAVSNATETQSIPPTTADRQLPFYDPSVSLLGLSGSGDPSAAKTSMRRIPIQMETSMPTTTRDREEQETEKASIPVGAGQQQPPPPPRHQQQRGEKVPVRIPVEVVEQRPPPSPPSQQQQQPSLRRVAQTPPPARPAPAAAARRSAATPPPKLGLQKPFFDDPFQGGFLPVCYHH